LAGFHRCTVNREPGESEARRCSPIVVLSIEGDYERCSPTIFGGQVFGRNLPRNLLAVPYAIDASPLPPLNYGNGAYGVVTSCPSHVAIPLGIKLYQRLFCWRCGDCQRHRVGALICTNFGRSARSNLLITASPPSSRNICRKLQRNPNLSR
jgi:hypothetical protein